MTSSAPMVRLLPTPMFGDLAVATVERKGVPIWSAHQISTALGYNSDRIRIGVRGEWADEFREGTDYHLIAGGDLAPLKGIGVVGKNAPSAVFLTESGVYLAAVLARTDVARDLRRWLADEVLPAIRRTGSYGKPADPVRVAREMRLGGDNLGAINHLRALVGMPLLDAMPSKATKPATIAVDRLRAKVEAHVAGVQEATATDIARALKIDADRRTLMEVGKAMAGLGWTRHRRRDCLTGLSWVYRRPEVS